MSLSPEVQERVLDKQANDIGNLMLTKSVFEAEKEILAKQLAEAHAQNEQLSIELNGAAEQIQELQGRINDLESAASEPADIEPDVDTDAAVEGS